MMKESNQTQALVGLCAIIFATVIFHAIWKDSLFPALSPAPRLSNTQSPSTPLEDAQFQAIMTNIATLSKTVAEMDASLRSTITAQLQALKKEGFFFRTPQQPAMTDNETKGLFSGIAMIPWIIGTIVYYDACARESGAFAMRGCLYAFMSANAGLMFAVLFRGAMGWAAYCLFVLWPMVATMVVYIFLAHGEIGNIIINEVKKGL